MRADRRLGRLGAAVLPRAVAARARRRRGRARLRRRRAPGSRSRSRPRSSRSRTSRSGSRSSTPCSQSAGSRSRGTTRAPACSRRPGPLLAATGTIGLLPLAAQLARGRVRRAAQAASGRAARGGRRRPPAQRASRSTARCRPLGLGIAGSVRPAAVASALWQPAPRPSGPPRRGRRLRAGGRRAPVRARPRPVGGRRVRSRVHRGDDPARAARPRSPRSSRAAGSPPRSSPWNRRIRLSAGGSPAEMSTLRVVVWNSVIALSGRRVRRSAGSLRYERAADHRVEARVALRGPVRAGVPRERAAGRARAQAREGDGRAPQRLGLARVRPERVHDLPRAGRPRAVRGLRGLAPRRAAGVPRRAREARGLRAAHLAAREARDRRGPRGRRLRDRDAARPRAAEAPRRAAEPGAGRARR